MATLDDVDVSTAVNDLRAAEAFVAGDFAAAARSWIQQAESSDLNAPYALPKAGLAAVRAGDAALAQEVIDRLLARGVRGRAIETDMALTRAGIKAIEGDAAAAMAGFRACMAVYRDLGLVWDEALLGLLAASTLGVADPEVAGWLGEARGTFEQLRATPLVDQADALAAPVRDGHLARRAGQTRGERAPDDRAQAEASSSST